MIVISKVDYKIYKKLKWLIYIVVNLLLVYTGLFGSEGGGAKRWIVLFGFNFQPSELAKLGFIVFFAAYMSEVKENGKIKSFLHRMFNTSSFTCTNGFFNILFTKSL